MLIRVISASVAAMLAASLLAVDAQADHRKRHRQARNYDYYYAGPEVVRGIPGIRLLFGDYALTEEEFDALYGDETDNFDESYYEPQPIAPVKPRNRPQKKTTATRKTATQDDVTTASVSKTVEPVSKDKADVAAPGKVDAAADSGKISCDKAGSIVSGYGFSSVSPTSCKGKVYAFNATRDGKSFTIKLDAASGELTEVKKLQ